jgi:hypothetical protein
MGKKPGKKRAGERRIVPSKNEAPSLDLRRLDPSVDRAAGLGLARRKKRPARLSGPLPTSFGRARATFFFLCRLRHVREHPNRPLKKSRKVVLVFFFFAAVAARRISIRGADQPVREKKVPDASAVSSGMQYKFTPLLVQAR